jgi:two-component system sensor histidine kinase YesM
MVVTAVKKYILKKYEMMKLTSKFTILILTFLMIPIGAFSLLIFYNMETAIYNDGRTRIVNELERSGQNAEQVAAICNLSTRMLVNNESMNDYLNQFDSNKKFSFMDILEFYGREISSVQKIVHSTPCLYKIRIFVNSDTVKETMPLLFKKEKIRKLKWGKDGIPPSGTWCFDYEDTLDTVKAEADKLKIVSVITRLNDYRFGQYGIIEVAATMKDMFPDIYNSGENQWNCFVDKEGNAYYDRNSCVKWKDHLEELRTLLHEEAESGREDTGADSRKMKLGKEKVLVGYVKIDSLDGYMVQVLSLSSEEHMLKTYKIDFMMLWIGIVVILLLLANRQVRHILRQFYEISEVVYRVQQGDMDIRIKNLSRDEFGILGKEINEMLNRIQMLMDETTRRELIVKDSQIKALQNQINAHFIYNVLESVKMMAEIDEKYEISDAVTSLGSMLRYSMHWKSQNVTIEEEIEYIRNYLALINLRFDYEIYLSLNIPKEMMYQSIPKMSLQPIIENAICHGIEELAENTSIYMKGIINQDVCYIKITDAGRGMSEEELERLRKRIHGELEDICGVGNGIGLKNVQDRLQISFGKDYGVIVASKEACYTQVVVKIPYRINKETGI